MKKQTNTSSLKFHEGRALGVIAETYPSLLRALLEVIQNAIDANAQNIWVLIDFRTRYLSVKDDGDGVTLAKFNKALSEVGVTQKDKKSLGQFGRGLVAPFMKCKSFKFTSCPKSRKDSYLTWEFDESLLEIARNLQVPVQNRPELRYDRKLINGVNWRSMMELISFSNDSEISRLDMNSLVAETIDAFGVVMRRRNIQVHAMIIDVKGSEVKKTFTSREFRGTFVGDFVFEGNLVGETRMKIFLANKIASKQKGQILVRAANDDFAIPLYRALNNFSNQNLLDAEIVRALTSGIFEGEIMSGINLNPNRKSFISDDYFLEFLIHLQQWYEEEGINHVSEAKAENRFDRYQELGLKSIKVVENLCQSHEFANLEEVLAKIKIGRIGTGHTDRKDIGEEDILTRTTRGRSTHRNDIGSGNGASTGIEEKDEIEERPGHMPFAVGGNKGNRKKEVRSSSIGIEFRYDEIAGSQRIYTYDEKKGILVFNVRHPLWAECEKKDSSLMRLQEVIAMNALTIASLPESQQDQAESYFMKTIGLHVFQILHARDIVRAKKSNKNMKGTIEVASLYS